MTLTEITEDMIFDCFAAAQQAADGKTTATSFVDVEEYENQIMYPEFARWAKTAGYPELAKLFLKVAGEEKLHAVWLRELYADIGTPERGEDTQRAIDALTKIRENCDALIAMNRDGVIEKALSVAISVEEREYRDIYPRFRDDALAAGRDEEAAVYQRVVDSEAQHAEWFRDALAAFRASQTSAMLQPA
ncbi:ferritin family protein [Thiosocius teredinicola]|uniref:ferritin family protein n=1 Tax=Thiosocius teredinicola TaxID=1973002 RepID=UPI000990E447